MIRIDKLLPVLSEEEEKVVQILSTEELNAVEIAADLNYSITKTKKILRRLMKNGVVVAFRYQQQILYSAKIKIDEYRRLGIGISLQERVSDLTQPKEKQPENGIIIEPKVSIELVKPSIENLLNVKVQYYEIIFYPYYACKIKAINVDDIRDAIREDLKNPATAISISTVEEVNTCTKLVDMLTGTVKVSLRTNLCFY